MLIAVLALVGVIAVLGAVILDMTVTATRTTSSLGNNTAEVSAADSALERVVNALRKPGAEGQDCHGAGSHGPGHPRSFRHHVSLPDGREFEVTVDCETRGALVPVRDVSLVAFVGDHDTPQGAARVKITDRIGAELRPGIELTVCDWQLGQQVGAELVDCS